MCDRGVGVCDRGVGVCDCVPAHFLLWKYLQIVSLSLLSLLNTAFNVAM